MKHESSSNNHRSFFLLGKFRIETSTLMKRNYVMNSNRGPSLELPVTGNFDFSLSEAESSAVSESAPLPWQLRGPFIRSFARVYGRSRLERLTKCFTFPSTFRARIGNRSHEPGVFASRRTTRNDVHARVRPAKREKRLSSINRNLLQSRARRWLSSDSRARQIKIRVIFFLLSREI